MSACVICGAAGAYGRSGYMFCRLHEAAVDAEIDETRAAGRRVDIGRIVLSLRGEQVTDYTLRTIPEGLWREVKVRAAQEGRTVREVILGLLERYAAGGDK